MICIFKKISKSEHPKPSQPLQPIYLWKWYISLKKWQSLNIRNLNIATLALPIHLWKWYISLKMTKSEQPLFIFENDTLASATLATYLSLKMIYIFKNDKFWTTATLATLATYLFWKWYISLKMTKSELPQPSQPLQPIYLWKWYISLKMTKSEHPQPSQA